MKFLKIIFKNFPLTERFAYCVFAFIFLQREIFVFMMFFCLFVLAKVWLHSLFQPRFTGDKAQGVSLLYASASKGNY